MNDGTPLPTVRLKAFARDDRALVRSWFSDSAIRAWWGAPAAIEAEIAIAIASETAICRMIEADGAIIGYAQALDAGLVASGDDRNGEPGIWQCTYFVGFEAHRGLGIGAISLDLLATEVFSTTLAIGCETRVPVRNESAVREIESKGFHWRRLEMDAHLGPFWIMRRDRGR